MYAKLRRRSLLLWGGLWGGLFLAKAAKADSAAVQVERRSLRSVTFYQARVDLSDPETRVVVGLANDAPQANSPERYYGDESFSRLVARLNAAVVVNGTFFNTRAVHHEVMGNLVSGGQLLRYRSWETRGTTLSLRQNNQPEMITPKLEIQPRQWEQYWFSITCGPRLLKAGEIFVSTDHAIAEGFTEQHLTDPAVPRSRAAIGFSGDGKQLFIVAFVSEVSLRQAAQILKDIGAAEAMNLDGGSSVALADRSTILYPAGRNLTNVIAVYDRANPAPLELQERWKQFHSLPHQQ